MDDDEKKGPGAAAGCCCCWLHWWASEVGIVMVKRYVTKPIIVMMVIGQAIGLMEST